jgi:hypothetical protein
MVLLLGCAGMAGSGPKCVRLSADSSNADAMVVRLSIGTYGSDMQVLHGVMVHQDDVAKGCHLAMTALPHAVY